MKVFENIAVIKVKTSHEESFIRVLELATEKDLIAEDIFMPYPTNIPVNKSIVKKARTGYIAFFCGLAGFVVALILLPYYQLGYTLNFGSKPDLPVISLFPLVFVMIILFAAAGTFIYFMISNHLIPGQQPKIYCHECTSNCFCILFNKKEMSGFSENIFEKITELEISEDIYIRQRVFLPLPLKISKI